MLRADRGVARWALRLPARAQLFASGLLFGLMAVLARRASQGAHGFGAAQLAALRFGVGVLACLALFVLRPGTFRPVRYRLLVTRGLFGGVAVLLYFIALGRIPAGEAALLNNTSPVFATVFAILTLGERPSLHLALALSIATAGVLCVLGGGGKLSLGWGELAGIGSAIVSAGAIAAIRALRPTDNAPTIFFAFCIGGLAVSLPGSLGAWPGDPRSWGFAVGVGLTSVGAQLLMTQALGSLTVLEASVWQQLTPVASYLWALALFNERVSGLGAVGVGLVVAGVAWGGILGPKPDQKAKATPRLALKP